MSNEIIDNETEEQPVPEPEREALLNIEAVTVRNDRNEMIFRDLDLRLERGRSAVITGSAGSGKTLLVELILGIRFPERGTVTVFGRQLKRRRRGLIRKVRRQIGGVGGMFDLAPSLTVAENIALPMVIAGERSRLQKDRLRRMLSEFSLLKRAGLYPRSLTRVENSLVQFARASVADQPLLIIDEPSAGLDRKTFQRVFEHLVRVSVSGRSMLILTSETPAERLPNTDYFEIHDGALQ